MAVVVEGQRRNLKKLPLLITEVPDILLRSFFSLFISSFTNYFEDI